MKKERAKRSILWKVPTEELRKLVQESSTFTAILNHFGLGLHGGNDRTLKARLMADLIDYSHIKEGRGSNKNRKFPVAKTPLEHILIEHSTFSRTHLKRRLIEEGLLINHCSECGLQPEWHGKPLTLVLDHINGIFDDNRLDNLRLLCPNCNSQTRTFCGRNTLSHDS
jgi:hypothetical protein